MAGDSMNKEELPSCECGAQAWKPGGGQGGAYEVNVHLWHCASCGRQAAELYHAGGSLLVVAANGTLSESDNDYINSTLLSAWRTRAFEIEAARAELSAGELERVNRELGLSESTKGDTVPRDLYGAWSRALDASDKAVREQLYARPEFHYAPTPPQLPESMVGYLRCDGKWTSVSHSESAKLPVPSNPYRVAHDRRYSNLFAKLNDLGAEIEPREIKNQYRTDRENEEPWYAFSVGGASFQVGPRHSVQSISVESDAVLDTAEIAEIADRDHVTYNDGSRYEAKGRKILIHAHGMDKMDEYLRVLIGAARRAY